ncbi:MAG: filamentous hemagglutinin N-terminal domain-containing protein, partial [Candidatus Omnitrophota bacterium]
MKNFFVYFFVGICILPLNNVYPLPQGENVVYGGASFDRSQPDVLDIDVSTDKMIAEYESFSIASNESVNFHQPSSTSVVLNRVVGADPSSIFGTLTANGRIFLVNPNGVVFGKGCKVDTAGLVASTLAISDNDFLNEKYSFRGKNKDGYIVNQGVLSSPGGYVALLGPSVENAGVIEAELGTVMLASGKKVTLSLDPQGIISVVVDKQTVQNLENKEDAVKNTGDIVAYGGKVILTAEVLGNIFERAINNEGVVRVDSLTQKGGEVVLEANEQIKTSGEINAGDGVVNVDCQGAGLTLGSIEAKEVNLTAGSVVDGNADATNVTATDLVISSSAGVGSQDALET